MEGLLEGPRVSTVWKAARPDGRGIAPPEVCAGGGERRVIGAASVVDEIGRGRDGLSTLRRRVPFGLGRVEFQVASEDADEARSLLEELERDESRRVPGDVSEDDG
jgi:hypothetical protein